MKMLRAARDWCAYHIVLRWPWSSISYDRHRHLGAAIWWALLPYAGNHAFREEEEGR